MEFNIAYYDMGSAMGGMHWEGRLVSKGNKIATVEVQVGPNKVERRRVPVEKLLDLEFARERTAHNRPEYARR